MFAGLSIKNAPLAAKVATFYSRQTKKNIKFLSGIPTHKQHRLRLESTGNLNKSLIKRLRENNI